MKPPLAIAVLGPTGSGKSSVAEILAERLDCSILNADAFQMVRGFDIGTNKPMHRARYRLIDVLEPTQTNTVGAFLLRARAVCDAAAAANEPMIVCGGTGLYVRALFEGFAVSPPPDPELRIALAHEHERLGAMGLLNARGISPDTVPEQVLKNRAHLLRFAERLLTAEKAQSPPAWNVRKMKFAIKIERDTLDAMIGERTEQMLSSGWIEEVRQLLTSGIPATAPAFRAIGYREIAQGLAGAADWAETKQRIITRTRQYAKRQVTWLRKEPNLSWVQWNQDATRMAAEIMEAMEASED